MIIAQRSTCNSFIAQEHVLQKTTQYEAQVTELREKLCKTELQLSDAQETSNNLKQVRACGG